MTQVRLVHHLIELKHWTAPRLLEQLGPVEIWSHLFFWPVDGCWWVWWQDQPVLIKHKSKINQATRCSWQICGCWRSCFYGGKQTNMQMIAAKVEECCNGHHKRTPGPFSLFLTQISPPRFLSFTLARFCYVWIHLCIHQIIRYQHRPRTQPVQFQCASIR